MTNFEIVNYRNIEFTRDTKIDYKAGNPIINTIFQQFDTDMSGDFDDTEWSNYQKHLENKRKQNENIEQLQTSNYTISHYKKQLNKITKQYDALSEKINKAMVPNYFDELLKFEESHPNVYREGYKDEKDIPQNAYKYDLSIFGMGIYDEEKQCFTGETYIYGSLKGLETLSPKERKQYLRLLDQASKMIKTCHELEKQLEKIEQELDRAINLCDMAQTGMIDKVGSKDYEDQAIQKYVKIRSEKNPFFKQIQKIEAMRNELIKKGGNRTVEDNKQLEAYSRQLDQLTIASQKWSIADTGTVSKFEIRTGTTYQKTYSLPDEESVKEGQINFSVGANGSYTDENFQVDASVNVTREFKNRGLLNNKYTSAFSAQYNRGKETYQAAANLDIDKDNRNYETSLGYSNQNFNGNIKNVQSYTRSEDGFNHTSDTNIHAQYTLQKYNFSADVNHNKELTTYAINTGMDEISTKVVNITPNLSNQYNSLTRRFTTCASLDLNKQYKKDDLSIGIQANDSYSLTYGHGKPDHENNLSVSTNIQYQGLQGEVKYNNMYSPYSKSHTYGASIRYATESAGTFGAEYSFGKTKNCEYLEKNQTFSITYSATIDTFKKWFKMK